MKKVLSFIITVVLVCSLALPVLTAHAYNKPVVTVSPSASSLVKGNNVTVTIKISTSDGKMGALDYQISYNAKVLQYVSAEGGAMVNGADGLLAASWFDYNGANSVTIKLVFKTIAAGSANVTATATTVADATGSEFPKPNVASTSVTVVTETPKSTNANLKSVTIAANDADGKNLTAKLAPAFSAGVVNYTITVPAKTHSVSITPTKSDSKASTKVEGSYTYVTGNWVRKVVVTAENGSQKTYTFKIVREGDKVTSNPTTDTSSTPEQDLRVIVDNKEYEIETNISNVDTPKGFNEDIAKYNGVDIPCFVNSDKSLTLVCLNDSDDKSTLFIYNAENISFETFTYVEIGAGKYIFFDAAKFTEDVNELTSKEITIGDKKVTAYCLTEDGEFVLVWAMGEDGKGRLYVYDTEGKTIQRYASIHNPSEEKDDEPIEAPPVEDDKKTIDFELAMLAFVVLVCIILILLVAWIAALIRLKRAYPTKKTELEFVPFFDDDTVLEEFNTGIENFSEQEPEVAQETEAEQETEVEQETEAEQETEE